MWVAFEGSLWGWVGEVIKHEVPYGRAKEVKKKAGWEGEEKWGDVLEVLRAGREGCNAYHGERGSTRLPLAPGTGERVGSVALCTSPGSRPSLNPCNADGLLVLSGDESMDDGMPARDKVATSSLVSSLRGANKARGDFCPRVSGSFTRLRSGVLSPSSSLSCTVSL